MIDGYYLLLALFLASVVLYSVVSRLSGLGYAYGELGQYEQAIEFHQQALAIAQETGRQGRQRIVLSTIGRVYRELSQYEQAIESFQQSLASAQAMENNGLGESLALCDLGDTYASLGQHEQAAEFYEQAAEILPSASCVVSQQVPTSSPYTGDR